MKKIIYFMNVDWNWIKQRPHFIAEGLAKNNDVTVVYKYRYNRTGFQKREEHQNVKPMKVIPLENKIPFVKSVNRFLMKMIIGHHIKKTKADMLYLTYPDQISCVPAWYEGQIIYDCMDYHVALEFDEKRKRFITQQERNMVEKADFILVSANNLKEKLLQNYGEKLHNKISLVRNGYNGPVLLVSDTTKEAKEFFTISYFGTISNWFDFDLINKSLEDFSNIKYELIGPVSEVAIPEHDRIVYKGTVEHEYLGEVVKSADCFIMPFVLNDIVEAVDPVKLYEYINFNKDILCVKYDEIKRFEPFVYFYHDYDSYRMQLEEIMRRTSLKYDVKERETFLLDNSWENRIEIIEGLWR